MEGINSFNDLDNNDWNNLVEGENGQYVLDEFAEKKTEKEPEVIEGESLKGEIIGGFEAKITEQTTGVKDTGHPERFEQRQMKELSEKALVALVSGEPKAFDVPGFWMREDDIAKNREAIDATQERLRTETSEEFEAGAKGLIEHVETGVAKNGVEATYDKLKDKNEALVMVYRETWESLKDEPAWKKEAGEISEEEKAELGRKGIEEFMKKYPTAADFRKAQREFFGHIKGDSANQKMIQDNLEAYVQAMSELGEALYGEQELDMRAMEGVRRQAKRAGSVEAEPVAEETETEEVVEEPKVEEVAEEPESGVTARAEEVAEEPESGTTARAEEVAEEPETVEEAGEPEEAEEAEKSEEPERAETEEEMRRKVERMAEEAKAASEASKAKAEAEKAEAEKAKGELAVSEEAEAKADKLYDEQYLRFARIANQRFLGFNRWREKEKPAEAKKAEKPAKTEKSEAKPKTEKKSEKKTEAKGAKIEEFTTLGEDREMIQTFEKEGDKKYGTGYYLDGKRYDGLTFYGAVKQELIGRFKASGNLFGKKQDLRISSPYEVEGRKAMAVYGFEKNEETGEDETVIRTVIQNLRDGKFYLMDRYKMLKHEVVDGKIDEGGVDWDATEEMLVPIEDEELQRVFEEIAKRKLSVPGDALRAALGLAEKQISLSRG